MVASCWLFLYNFYYDAWIHEHQVSVSVPSVRFGILMVVLLKIQVAWGMTLFLLFHKDHSAVMFEVKQSTATCFNPLKPELNPICYLLALFGAHHFLHVSRIGVKLLTLRRLMSYIYMEHPFLMFLDHTQRRSTVGRTPLDE